MSGKDQFIDEILELTQAVSKQLLQNDLRIAIAESCTGGGISYFLTDIPGSSKWFDCGFVTYANEAKQRMIGVNEATLNEFGAVSENTVAEMAQGALDRSQAQVAVAVSGVAGPTGGTPEKPVGMVCFAWGFSGEKDDQKTTADLDPSTTIITKTEHFQGDRIQIRQQSIATALRGVLSNLG